MYYIVLHGIEQRNKTIQHCKNAGINTAFHYQPLHQSIYYNNKHDGLDLPNCTRFANGLLRLPLYYDLQEEQIEYITNLILGEHI